MSQTARAVLESDLRGTLLTQVKGSDVQYRQLIELTDRPGRGLVITGERALHEAQLLRQRGYVRPILADAGRYAGTGRLPASHPFDSEWIDRQRRLGLMMVPDAGYVAEGDRRGLASVLWRTRQLGDGAVALLALHRTWLDERRGLPFLIDRVQHNGVPVAIVVEDGGDPFATQFVLTGLLELLSQPTPVMLLRCDVSAVGALCFGAVAAAVGATSSLRHLYPITTSRPPWRRAPSALIRPCLRYMRLPRIERLASVDPDHRMWRCQCRLCADRSITVLASYSANEQELACATHSLDLLDQLGCKILDDGMSPRDQAQTWISTCKHAEADADELDRAEAAIFPVDDPAARRRRGAAALRNWQTLGTAYLNRRSPR